MNVLSYLPAAAWAAFVLFLGSRPFANVPGYDLPLDKLVHFALYGILGGLAAVGWRTARRKPHLVIPLTVALLVGSVDELSQRRVATRTADWWDWGVDVIAVSLAFGLVARRRAPTVVEGEPG